MKQDGLVTGVLAATIAGGLALPSAAWRFRRSVSASTNSPSGSAEPPAPLGDLLDSPATQGWGGCEREGECLCDSISHVGTF